MNTSAKSAVLFAAALVFHTSSSAFTVEETTGEATNYAEKRESIQELGKRAGTVYRLAPIEAVADEIPTEECFEIDVIRFPGATLLSESRKARFTEDYLNDCDSVEDLNMLTRELTEYYVENGYITSKAFLMPQDLSAGEIDITVLEGRIEKFKIKQHSVDLLYYGYTGGLLNINELKSGLELLNRLKSSRVTMALKPSQKSGYTVVEITHEKTGPEVTGYLHYSTHNGKDLQWAPLGIGVDWENTFGYYDKLSMHFNRIRQSNNKDTALGSAIVYELPIRQIVYTAGISLFSYDQSLANTAYNYSSYGQSQVYSLTGSYLLENGQSNRLSIEAGMVYKRNTSFLPNADAGAINYSLGYLDLGLLHTYYSDNFFIDSQWHYNRGAVSNGEFFDNAYDRFSVDAELTSYIGEEYPFIYTLKGFGQYSGNDLPGTEQMSIGGPYTVRGYKYYGIGGRSGGYIRNELLYEKRLPFANFYPFVGLDYGKVSCDTGCDEAIYSSTVGVRMQERDFNFEFFYAAPLNEDLSEKKQDLLSRVNISLVLSF